MAATDTFDDVFARLKNIMQPYGEQLECTKDYVSYHLMPVYVFPELLDAVSPALRKRMQGKSCFNFSCEDPALFEELAGLTRAGFDRYKASGYVS